MDNYLSEAGDEICVLVQVESVAAMEALGSIAAVDGVDGVFFGPADLAASMGMLGKPGDPAVQSAIAGGIALVRKMGKAAGTLSADRGIAAAYLSQGANFAVGVDTTLLVAGAKQLLAKFKGPPSDAQPSDGAY
jgi:4-hydroxy-2-oxoheptanedioate aldolase